MGPKYKCSTAGVCCGEQPHRHTSYRLARFSSQTRELRAASPGRDGAAGGAGDGRPAAAPILNRTLHLQRGGRDSCSYSSRMVSGAWRCFGLSPRAFRLVLTPRSPGPRATWGSPPVGAPLPSVPSVPFVLFLHRSATSSGTKPRARTPARRSCCTTRPRTRWTSTRRANTASAPPA